VSPEPEFLSSREAVGAILDSISEGVFSVDPEWRITSFNRAAERILGVSREQVIGRRCRDVLRADICSDSCALRYTLETGLPVVNFAARLTHATGSSIPVGISTAVLRRKNGRVIGAVETFRDLSLVDELRRKVEQNNVFENIVGQSDGMRRLFELVPIIAASDSTVLIQGESGTGKELLARAIHNLSARSSRPLVTVDCGTIPDSLLESELFGVKAGAYTGATHSRTGKVNLAEGGTLFFDEIGALPQALQVKLLRLIQERVYERLGDPNPIDADLRFIAATNHDLAEAARDGTFREDLYFRLNVFCLEIPPLRDRRDDIPLLVNHFLAGLTATLGKDVTTVAPEALAALVEYDYPGNVRELANAIEHAFVLCPGSMISQQHLPAAFQRDTPEPSSATLATRVGHFEAQLIAQALRLHHGNRGAAARDLGIHRTTLFKKMRKHRLTSAPESGDRSDRRS
jgi:PAS domain S-box-containing protein